MIALTVHLKVDAAREDESLAAIGDDAVASRAEPRCADGRLRSGEPVRCDGLD